MASNKEIELNNEQDFCLIDLIKKGDDFAFAELTKKYDVLISKKCSSFSHLADFEDLYQEGVIALYYAAKSYNLDLSSFFTYFSVCIEHALISYCRASKNKNYLPAQKTVPFDDEHTISFSSPEQLFIEKENRNVLFEMVKNSLSDFEFTVLVNFNYYGSYEEVAKKLSVSTKSVSNALQRARKKVLDIKNF